MFLEVGETDRPRFPPVYSAILGAGYSRLHFSAPSSLAPRPVLLNATAYLFLVTFMSYLPSLPPVYIASQSQK